MSPQDNHCCSLLFVEDSFQITIQKSKICPVHPPGIEPLTSSTDCRRSDHSAKHQIVCGKAINITTIPENTQK